MLKPSYKVDLHLNGQDSALTFDDAVAEGKGTAAYNAVWGGHDIKIVDYSGKDYVVPLHLLVYAEITKTQTTVTVVDDTCPSDESE